MKKQEHNREALKKGIQELKQHKAPDFLWQKIEKEIAPLEEIKKTALEKAIHELPKYKLEKDLWRNIENDITKGRTRSLFQRKVVLKIAATLVLFIGVSVLIKKQIQHRGVIEISTAIIDDKLFNTGIVLENCTANQKEIDQLCTTIPETCEDPFVKELKEQLNEVNDQYKELKTIIESSPTQELMKYLERIENEKCKIENELLTLIINS